MIHARVATGPLPLTEVSLEVTAKTLDTINLATAPTVILRRDTSLLRQEGTITRHHSTIKETRDHLLIRLTTSAPTMANKEYILRPIPMTLIGKRATTIKARHHLLAMPPMVPTAGWPTALPAKVSLRLLHVSEPVLLAGIVASERYYLSPRNLSILLRPCHCVLTLL